MSDELEIVRGSGNVFRDFSDPDADIHQMKGILAAIDRKRIAIILIIPKLIRSEFVRRRVLIKRIHHKRKIPVTRQIKIIRNWNGQGSAIIKNYLIDQAPAGPV